ncbi:hypothetical protein PDTK01_31070 [Phycicoccus sp. DTK01]|nr:hypothetical protein PDTK01_31070 [Phycicoccus sp. DTK01]
MATAVAAVLTALAWVAVPPASGAFTSAVPHTASVSANPSFTCQLAATSGQAGPAALVTYPFADSSGTKAADTSGSVGSPRDGTYSAKGVTYQATGPCARDKARAVTLDGSTGMVAGPSSTLAAAIRWSEEVWFRGTSGAGDLLAFASSATGDSGTAVDRRVYLTSTGRLVAGVLAGGTTVRTVTSPRTYTDDVWHHVVVTQATPTDAQPGLRLYVDGVLVASDTTVTTSSGLAQYWRIGNSGHGAAATRWPGETSTTALAGTLAFASYYTSALGPTDVLRHYAAGRAGYPKTGRWSFSRATVGDSTSYLRHWAFRLYVDPISMSDPVGTYDSTWKVESGLADPRCFSFRSTNYPDRLIRHTGEMRMVIEVPDGSTAWDQSATFCPHLGNNGEGTSWSAYDTPTRYWRSYGNEVWLASDGGPNWFDDHTNWADETSWNTRPPVVP